MSESRFFGMSLQRIAVLVLAIIFAYPLAYKVLMEARMTRDMVASYRGVVVTKGDTQGPLWGAYYSYLVIRDSTGRETRRWVSIKEYADAVPGTFVEHSPGVSGRDFGEHVLRPGQLTINQTLDSAEALEKERDPARRDSLIAHLRR